MLRLSPRFVANGIVLLCAYIDAYGDLDGTHTTETDNGYKNVNRTTKNVLVNITRTRTTNLIPQISTKHHEEHPTVPSKNIFITLLTENINFSSTTSLPARYPKDSNHNKGVHFVYPQQMPFYNTTDDKLYSTNVRQTPVVAEDTTSISFYEAFTQSRTSENEKNIFDMKNEYLSQSDLMDKVSSTAVSETSSIDGVSDTIALPMSEVDNELEEDTNATYTEEFTVNNANTTNVDKEKDYFLEVKNGGGNYNSDNGGYYDDDDDGYKDEYGADEDNDDASESRDDEPRQSSSKDIKYEEASNADYKEPYLGPIFAQAQLDHFHSSNGMNFPVLRAPFDRPVPDYSNSLSLLVFYAWVVTVMLMIIGAVFAIKHRQKVKAIFVDNSAFLFHYQAMSLRDRVPIRTIDISI